MSAGKAAGVVGGVCMARAPQFFTLPEIEDKATVDRVHALADPSAYAAALDLPVEEQAALVNNDGEEMIALGVHPFLPFMARLHLERERNR